MGSAVWGYDWDEDSSPEIRRSRFNAMSTGGPVRTGPPMLCGDSGRAQRGKDGCPKEKEKMLAMTRRLR